MKFTSPVYSEASGSIAGITYARNRGGLYTRARAVPTNPNTFRQQTVRSAMGLLTGEWSTVLTPAQREAWDLYALNTPITNPLGAPRNVGGLGMFVRGNVGRIQAGLSPILDAGVSGFPPIGVIDNWAFTSGTGLISADIQGSGSQFWMENDDAALFLYVSRPTSATVNYFNGPYVFAGRVDGNSVTPPIALSILYPFSQFISSGQVIQIRVSVSDQNARLSADFKTTITAP